MKNIFLFSICIFLSFFFVSSCQKKVKKIRIAATPVPHADLLEAIKSDLKKEGYILEIVEVDDYLIPNRLLYEGQVDANFFQHFPFLESQRKEFGYNLISLTRVHIEPMGIYSKKIHSLKELKNGAIVAIPSDPSNEDRALRLLEKENLITLKNKPGLVSLLDIDKNIKNLRLEEVDAALLPRILSDVDIALIPANFAIQVNLYPHKDALSLESINSPYANILVIRPGEERREELQKIAEFLTSPKMRVYILEKYEGVLHPVF